MRNVILCSILIFFLKEGSKMFLILHFSISSDKKKSKTDIDFQFIIIEIKNWMDEWPTDRGGGE